MRLKVTRSTGDVFRDLGFPAEEAEHLRIRSDLLIELQKTIGKRRLKQAEGQTLYCAVCQANTPKIRQEFQSR
jgi:predicted XRE-type DNA-binding protein